MSALRELYGSAFPLISRYIDILGTKGTEWGLIGPRELDRLWDRHVANSVAVADLLPEGSSVVDVGSGAGLPGLPLAILRADLQVTLLEPLLRRSIFLTETVAELGLGDRVRVVRGRAEDHRVTYDVVTSRALAPLERLVGWCAPLRARDGDILAIKGRTAAEEIDANQHALAVARLSAEVLSVRAYPDADPATVIRLRSNAVPRGPAQR